MDSKNGCSSASFTSILVDGLRSSILSSRSIASAGTPGNTSYRGTLALGGSESIYFKAYSLVICFFVSAFGVPLKLIIKFTYSM